MNDVLDITWAVTTRYRTRMTNDEARQWFGLGGTTDADLPGRIEVLTRADPRMLQDLTGAGFADAHPAENESFELRAIEDAKTGMSYYHSGV